MSYLYPSQYIKKVLPFSWGFQTLQKQFQGSTQNHSYTSITMFNIWPPRIKTLKVHETSDNLINWLTGSASCYQGC